ncbi:uncharacterized protein LY79DRAFT_357726 [Colletotrichum navitas]|uniref:Uncharacterized protein n=1 Tax=Colletotrichum navitas TaxID=681940 RepID=A0AAD8PS57_9PEZI|nr:uncharacterized protein LY79DRAFT_357726 [Colletotrichum navitas]KAK1579150.1 hypothetical protein LY79DRAFT_357726 [Colletotrichum navitas]
MPIPPPPFSFFSFSFFLSQEAWTIQSGGVYDYGDDQQTELSNHQGISMSCQGVAVIGARQATHIMTTVKPLQQDQAQGEPGQRSAVAWDLTGMSRSSSRPSIATSQALSASPSLVPHRAQEGEGHSSGRPSICGVLCCETVCTSRVVVWPAGWCGDGSVHKHNKQSQMYGYHPSMFCLFCRPYWLSWQSNQL